MTDETSLIYLVLRRTRPGAADFLAAYRNKERAETEVQARNEEQVDQYYLGTLVLYET